MLIPEDHKTLKFRDKHTIISRVLIFLSVCIFVVAATMMTLAVQRSLKRQTEMTKLIGLAEAQGGDITVARQIYDAIQKIGKLTKLPDTEIPVYATIAEVEKLKAQPVFKDAVNGDKILFYTKSQWIYIYREQSNKLIAQGPFSLPTQPPQQAETQPAPEPQNQQMTEPQAPPAEPPEMQQVPPTAPPPMPSSPVSASPEADINQ